MAFDLENKIAIMTGATGAIGEAIARGLAETGLSLVLIARSSERADAVIDRISKSTGNRKVSYLLADLARQAQIINLAADWTDPLHILVNNAAVAPPTRKETPEGIELQFATNVLSYHWMINAFSKYMFDYPGSRIVNVASYWAGDLMLDDLEFTRRPYHNHAAYRQSKQANRMLTPIFASMLQPHGVAVNACHPGDVNSQLSNDLGFGGSQSPDQGADTPIWLATSPEVAGITGKYFEHRNEVNCPFAFNRKASRQLFDLCNGYTQPL